MTASAVEICAALNDACWLAPSATTIWFSPECSTMTSAVLVGDDTVTTASTLTPLCFNADKHI